MNCRTFTIELLILCSCAVTGLHLCAADKTSLDPNLEPLRPWLDKTWKGEFKNSTPEKPVIDIARWERALNGKAVRILHSINKGVYGGESIVTWDPKQQAVTYHYFTTGGFMTKGTMSFKDGKVMTHEVVQGSSQGVSEVRGTSEIRPDGTFHIKTEHLKDGQWMPGRDVVNKEDPSSKVEFQ